MLTKLRPLLHSKWEVDQKHLDFIHGTRPDGSAYLVVVPPDLRNLVVLLQNNLSMQMQYVDQLQAELESAKWHLEALGSDIWHAQTEISITGRENKK